MSKQQSLADSARASLLWGGGFIFARDLIQFATMLVLVRLLNPSDYGTAALAQSIVGVMAICSFSTFSTHVLQMRDPHAIDWQVHFTAAVLINCTLTGLILLLAYGLSLTEKYCGVALPLAVLAIVFLVEIPGTLRHRMLEANHQWKRFRILLIIGTILGLGTGLAVGLAGGGVWALIVQPLLFGLPAAIDLFVGERFRPTWAWKWDKYRETVRFGLDRFGAGVAGRGRVLNEQVLLSSYYDFATLGIFTRATGLANLLAGRIGGLMMLSLYPVITRAEPGSARFQRMSSLVLRGILWSTLPAATFLVLTAEDTVTTIYGLQWSLVVPLLPIATLAITATTMTTTLSSLLVANNNSRTALALDITAAISGVLVAIVLLPFGMWTYLSGLCLHSLAIAGVTIAILLRRGAISNGGTIAAIVPATSAALVAVIVVITVRHGVGASEIPVVRLCIDALLLSTTYLATLRIGFSTAVAELLEVAPGGSRLAQILGLGVTQAG